MQDAMDKVKVIREYLLVAQSRQKAYADHRRCDLEFTVGDMVSLKVSPMRGVMRFGKRWKLNPRYLEGVHPGFHVPILRKYLLDPSHAIQPQEVHLDDTLAYEEVPDVTILD